MNVHVEPTTFATLSIDETFVTQNSNEVMVKTDDNEAQRMNHNFSAPFEFEMADSTIVYVVTF